jgi:DNA polymerase
MARVYFDFETRSAAPVAWGLDNYFLKAEPLILTWAVDDGPVQIMDYSQEPIPRLPRVFREPGHTFIAHNCQFDRRVLERLFDLHRPIEDYRCTQAQAYAHGLPGSLETLGQVLGITKQKLTGDDGHKLMLFFCTPRSVLKDGSPKWNAPEDHPEKWEAFRRYAIRDVEALREVHRKLPTWNYQGENLQTWFLDQRINERGFGFDSQLAEAARKVLDTAKVAQREHTQRLTGGEVGSVTQREKLLEWFNKSGLPIASLRASDVRDALESDDLPPEHRRLLELRLEGSKSSGAKYRRGLDCVGPDGRLRDTMVYCGASRTGRWSGRTLQPQNLSRYSQHWETINKDAPHEPIEQIVLPAILRGDIATLEAHGGVNTCCNDAIRSAIVAAPGNELIAADWSNIEGRVLAWLAEDWGQLEYFRAQDRGEAPDSYKLQWAQMFKIPVEQVTKNQRQASKQLKLACNYLGGVGALITMALGNNLDLEELMVGVLEQVPEDIRKKSRTAWRRAFLEGEDFGLAPWVYQSCDALVRLFRQANETVTAAGYGLGSVVMDAMKNPNTLFTALKCQVWYDGGKVIIQLPCGRRLFYWSPEVRVERQVDELTGEEKLREVFYYRASRGKQWRVLRGWAGLFTENVTQGVANSVLRAGLLNVERHHPGAVVMHVHDEVVCEAPVGSLPPGELERLLTSDLSARHPWMAGLPLAASAWRGARYRK